MVLKPELPWIVSQNQAGDLLISQDGNSLAISTVGNAVNLPDGVLPAVHEHGAARAVGNYHIGPVRFHRLKLLSRGKERVAPVGLHQVLSEAEAATVTPFRVINDITAPSFNHANQ